MTIRDAYSHWSTNYDTDRNLTRDLDQEITRQALAHLQPATILELGCGTGKNTPFLAQLGGHVLALDFSEGMLAQARAKLHAAHNVTFAMADLTQPLPAATSAIDLVICNLVLEHLQDLRPIFAEAWRVLTKGGQFYLSELHPFKQYQGKQAVFQHGAEQVAVTAFIHHTSDFVQAALDVGFGIQELGEYWHEEDRAQAKPPRLLTLRLGKISP
jgi:malonyl-CoA O-methyltransferase